MMRLAALARFASLLAIALFVAPSARAADANTIVRPTMQVTVKAGEELLVRAHFNWTKQCQPERAPGVKIVRAPQSGTVDVRPGDYTVKGSLQGNTVCNGKSLPGIGVFYKAGDQPGTDSFHYQEVVGGTRPNSTTRTQEIEVEVTIE